MFRVRSRVGGKAHKFQRKPGAEQPRDPEMPGLILEKGSDAWKKQQAAEATKEGVGHKWKHCNFCNLFIC